MATSSLKSHWRRWRFLERWPLPLWSNQRLLLLLLLLLLEDAAHFLLLATSEEERCREAQRQKGWLWGLGGVLSFVYLELGQRRRVREAEEVAPS
jgi:hypothetical protein